MGEMGLRGRTVRFQLTAPGVGCAVDVRLDDRGDRWLAVADYDGRREVALAATARAALTSSLAPLGRDAVIALLANPALFEVSCAVHKLVAAR